MAATAQCEDQCTITNLPSNRKYESKADAELDDALVSAIKRAQEANNQYLATVLENELKSHYYGSRLGL